MTKHKDILQAAICLNAAVSNTRLYAADHPQVMRYLEQTHAQLQDAMQRQAEITYLIIDDDVVVGNHALTSITPQLNQFVELLKQCAIERLTFTPEVSIDGLTRLVKDLAATGQEVVRSVPGITLGKIKVMGDTDAQADRELLAPEIKQKLAELEQFRNRSLDDIKDLYHQIGSDKQITALGLGEIVQGFLQGMLRNVNPLQMLAALKTSDEYTFTHAINVCILTMAQAEFIGIKGRMLYDIGIAGAMHDAGKMFVPDEILNKPDKLTNKEWAHMREHSAEGALYILRLEGIPKVAFLGALEHHIRFDGSGYPDLGGSWHPSVVSQMIAIADMFDAMRSRRPYKDPKPDGLIIKILREESGTAFNPQLVESFLRLIKPQEPPS